MATPTLVAEHLCKADDSVPVELLIIICQETTREPAREQHRCEWMSWYNDDPKEEVPLANHPSKNPADNEPCIHPVSTYPQLLKGLYDECLSSRPDGPRLNYPDALSSSDFPEEILVGGRSGPCLVGLVSIWKETNRYHGLTGDIGSVDNGLERNQEEDRAVDGI